METTTDRPLESLSLGAVKDCFAAADTDAAHFEAWKELVHRNIDPVTFGRLFRSPTVAELDEYIRVYS